jgi:hypothetical protein
MRQERVKLWTLNDTTLRNPRRCALRRSCFGSFLLDSPGYLIFCSAMLRRTYCDLRSLVNMIPFQEKRFLIAELRKHHLLSDSLHCLLLMHKNIIQQQPA